MRFTTVYNIPLPELKAMANGALEDTISDLDFLETLAAHRCFIVPPFILRASASGGLTQVTPLVYDSDGELDKARLLVAIARQLPRLNRNKPIQEGPWGGRFATRNGE